jgi:hypothetical protein
MEDVERKMRSMTDESVAKATAGIVASVDKLALNLTEHVNTTSGIMNGFQKLQLEGQIQLEELKQRGDRQREAAAKAESKSSISMASMMKELKALRREISTDKRGREDSEEESGMSQDESEEGAATNSVRTPRRLRTPRND